MNINLLILSTESQYLSYLIFIFELVVLEQVLIFVL